MKKIVYKFIKFFDLNVGWFFINGMRQDWHREQLRKKYGDNHEI